MSLPADVAKGAVVVLEELGRRQAAVSLPGVGVRVGVRVDDEQVLPAVVVVVEPADPAAHHCPIVVRHPVAEGALPEVEADLPGHVAEAKTAGARLQLAGRLCCRRRRGLGRARGGHDQEPAAALLQLEGMGERHQGVLADGQGRQPAVDGALDRSGGACDHRRRPLVLPGLQLEAQPVDAVGRHLDRM